MKIAAFLRITTVVIAMFFLMLLIPRAHALGVEYTVCGAGCDFTTLTDAVAFPGINQDTITLSTGFVYNDALEDDNIFIPDEITLQCDTGVTFGDALQGAQTVWIGSDNVIQNCTFENIYFDASGKTNVEFINNTISSAALQQLTFTNTDSFEVSGNTGIQKVQVQNSNNGLIDNNDFECRFGDNCITLSTAGGGPFDYSDPADVPSFIDITNNNIVNYNVTTGGDFVQLFAGVDNTFTNNTISSGVTVDNSFLTMVTAQTGNPYIAENLFLMPEKAGGGGNGTWAINMRISDADLSALVENNTVIMNENNVPTSGNACIGLFDQGGFPNYSISLEANYNLCYNPLTAVNGTGVALNYNIGSITLNFQDKFNGMYNIENLINDDNAVYTGLNSNTLTSNPLFKTENADANDDYELNPISRYLDVDITRDIGAFPDTRVSTYHIDDTCTVDYMTCYSNLSGVLPHAVTTGDTITVANGTYDGFKLDYPATNVTFSGEGDGTVFDAGGAGSALILNSISDSGFSNFQLMNSMATTVTNYEITNLIYDYNGNTYNQTSGFFGSDNVTLVFEDASCTVVPVSADGTDVTTAVDAATDDWNLVLIDAFGAKLTGVIPDRLISNAVDMNDYLTNQCGVGATVDLFLESAFEVSALEYTYDAAAVALTGAVLTPGYTNPPRLDRFVITSDDAGLLLQDSSNNQFEELSINTNSVGVNFEASSVGNTIKNSILANNTVKDIISTAANDNTLEDTDLTIAKLEVDAAGNLNIYYTVQVMVQNTATLSPIVNANVTIKDALDTTLATLITDGTGKTPLTSLLLATVLAQGDPVNVTAGGYNPFKITASASPYSPVTVDANIDSPQQLVNVNLSSGGSSSGGGAGGRGGRGVVVSGTESSQSENNEEEQLTEPDDCIEFIDTQNHWTRGYIQIAKNQGYIQGYENCEFRPDQPINRAEVSKIIAFWKNHLEDNLACLEQPFPDVECDTWYGKIISYLKDEGIVEGYGDGLFYPEKNVSRAESLKMLIFVKNLDGTDVENYKNPFCDVQKNEWYYNISLIGSKMGIVEGYLLEDSECESGSELKPNQSITRAEFTKIFVETLLNL
ncbi:MAG: S-layer homology domain-containing protein [Candidatus Gracilibacteria bacterium]